MAREFQTDTHDWRKALCRKAQSGSCEWPRSKTRMEAAHDNKDKAIRRLSAADFIKSLKKISIENEEEPSRSGFESLSWIARVLLSRTS